MSNQFCSPMLTRKGWFTLVELITAMAVLLILMSSLMGIFVAMDRIARTQRSTSDIYAQQRLLFDLLTRDLLGLYTSNVPGSEVVYRMETPAGGGSGYRARFVTTSGVGLDMNTTNQLVEVGYYLDGYTLRRVSSGRNHPEWNPVGKTAVNMYLPDGGTTGFHDSATVCPSVYEFSVQAVSVSGNLITTDTSTLPAMVLITASIFDPKMAGGTWTDTDIRRKMVTFRKKLFFNRRAD